MPGDGATVAPLLAALLVGALVAAPGCQPSAVRGVLRIWAVGPGERPGSAARGDSTYYSAARDQVELFGALNEVVPFQLALAADRPVTVRVEFENLVGPQASLAADGFRAYAQRSVTIRPAPAWFLRRYGPTASVTAADILVPLDGPTAEAAVPSGGVASLWMEYQLPPDASPGEYRGAIVLRMSNGAVQRAPVLLRVRPFALPQQRHLAIVTGVDAGRMAALLEGLGQGEGAAVLDALDDERRARLREAVTDVCRMLHAHRLDPYVTGLYPPMRFAADGSIEVQWSRYDELTGPLIDGSAYADGIPVRWWGLPIDRNRPSAATLGGVASPEYGRVLRETLAACARHFAQRGWSRVGFVDLTGPVPVNPTHEDYESAARLGRLTKQAAASVPAVVNLLASSPEPYGWPGAAFADLSETAGIWSPPGQFFDARRMAELRSQGIHTWLAPDAAEFSGSVAAEASAADVRSVGWRAFLHDSDVWLPRSVNWPAGGPPTVMAPHVSADWLVYPGAVAGRPGLLPSLRLKRLMQAAQDYEYLWLLRQNGRGETARLVAESLVRATGTDACLDQYADAMVHGVVADPNAWELGRRLLADEIEDAISGASAAGGPERFEQRLEWSRFLTMTRPVLVWSEGVRWSSPPHGSAAGEWLVEFRIAVENRQRVAVSGTLSFGALPPGWQAVTDDVPVGPLPERGRGRFRLAARADSVPVSLDGHLEQSIFFRSSRGAPRELRVASSVLTVRPASRTPVIDGVLNDWELGRGNVASDFYAVGPLVDAAGEVAAAPRSADGTVVFAARDAGNLYLAIRCTGAAGGAVTHRDNAIAYDGLMPTGEDLVEVILDPTNSSGDTSGLIHLAFKRYGAMWAERGIGLPRPIGRSVAAAGLEVHYATRPDREGWTVEARIPLRGMTGETGRTRIWGVNFARSSGGSGDYSNWSGAARYCYNPLSLGNLVWSD